jgi:plasmid stabilization system protein ParE
LTTVRVVVSDLAERQIQIVDDWWREHRPAAPELFSEELAAIFEVLAALPFAGQGYDHPALDDMRRILLRATRYHVYYRVRDDAVIVLAVWSAVRGTGPDLTRSI